MILSEQRSRTYAIWASHKWWFYGSFIMRNLTLEYRVECMCGPLYRGRFKKNLLWYSIRSFNPRSSPCWFTWCIEGLAKEGTTNILWGTLMWLSNTPCRTDLFFIWLFGRMGQLRDVFVGLYIAYRHFYETLRSMTLELIDPALKSGPSEDRCDPQLILYLSQM